MKKRIFAVVFAVLVTSFLGAGVVLAGPLVHKASGGGWIDRLPGMEGGELSVGFNAQIDADDSVKGQINVNYLKDQIKVAHANIDCLVVYGNKAYLTGEITQAENPFWTTVAIEVIDNGEGSASPPDRFALAFSTASSTNSLCKESWLQSYLDLGLDDWTHGNAQVK
jgi:hypothetical protein